MKIYILEHSFWVDFDYGPEYEVIDTYEIFKDKQMAIDKLKENVSKISNVIKGSWIDDITFSFNDETLQEHCSKWRMREVEI